MSDCDFCVLTLVEASRKQERETETETEREAIRKRRTMRQRGIAR